VSIKLAVDAEQANDKSAEQHLAVEHCPQSTNTCFDSADTPNVDELISRLSSNGIRATDQGLTALQGGCNAKTFGSRLAVSD